MRNAWRAFWSTFANILNGVDEFTGAFTVLGELTKEEAQGMAASRRAERKAELEAQAKLLTAE